MVGRVIRALQKCFHPDCFRCQVCRVSLVEIGFAKHNGRFAGMDIDERKSTRSSLELSAATVLRRRRRTIRMSQHCPCAPRASKSNDRRRIALCLCSSQVIDGKCLKYRGEVHHPAHFQCSSCRSVHQSCCYSRRDRRCLSLESTWMRPIEKREVHCTASRVTISWICPFVRLADGSSTIG